MAFIPSINDVPKMGMRGGFQPSLSDIPGNAQNPADLLSQIQTENSGAKQNGMQDIMPDYARHDIEKALGLGLMFSNPEIAAPKLVSPLVNAAARVGSGATGNTLLDAPDSMHQYMQDLNKNLKSNAILEAAFAPFRAAGKMAELFNPLQYVKNKLAEIKNGYQDAVSLQKEAYKPVFDKYGENALTVTPKKYFGFDDSMMRRFTPEITKSYKDFLNEPTFQKAHDLQAQMYRDYSKIKNTPGKINQAQSIADARDMVENKINRFLQRDKNALNQYQEGSRLTKDVVSPYKANEDLTKFATGKVSETTPNNLINTIKNATESLKKDIPDNHHLHQVLNEVQKKVNLGNAMQHLVPALGGAVAGSEFHPLLGLGGAAGGAALGHYLMPGMTEFIQNPLVRSIANNIENPLYYAGRSAIGYNQDQ